MRKTETLTLTCPECGNQEKADPKCSGKKLRCLKCRTEFIAPRAFSWWRFGVVLLLAYVLAATVRGQVARQESLDQAKADFRELEQSGQLHARIEEAQRQGLSPEQLAERLMTDGKNLHTIDRQSDLTPSELIGRIAGYMLVSLLLLRVFFPGLYRWAGVMKSAKSCVRSFPPWVLGLLMAVVLVVVLLLAYVL